MTYVLVFLASVVVGMAVESHWCGHRHQARKQEARLALAISRLRQWQRAAKYWHSEFEREKRTADGHAEMLRALGRAVAEGQTIESTEGMDNA